MAGIMTIPFTITRKLLSLRPKDVVFVCKWIISYIYIELSRRLTKKRFDLYDVYMDNDAEKLNFITPREEFILESPYPESHLLNAADQVFFYGVNSKSEFLVARIARGCNDEAEAWIYMKLNNGKVYQLKETCGYQHSCSEKKTFTCGGLQMHYLNPMRTWRIFFNGLLRETCEENPETGQMIHVKFTLLWISSSDVFDVTSDLCSSSISSAMANVNWNQFKPPLERLYSALDSYAQTGIITGSVCVDGSTEDHELYLFGQRTRYLGNTSFIEGAEFFHVFGQIRKNGAFVHVMEASIPNVVENLTYGFIVQPDSQLKIITGAQIRNVSSSANQKHDDISAHFQAGDKSYELEASVVGWQTYLKSRTGWDGQMSFNCLDLQLNSLKGSGVVLTGKVIKPSKRSISATPEDIISSDVPRAVQFSEQICQEAEVTGGKGSSLGKLTHLSKIFLEFVVPNGIVVTTSAYKEFITEATLKEIKYLEDVLYGNTEGNVKTACQSVMDEIVRSNIPQQTEQAIVKTLQQAFGQKWHSNKFAVRSSATGEDTEQMSAAGQMETYLGVTGLSEIMLAVKKCWASQFGFIAVQYKRQNGQIINSPMAVVIQEMVACDVAGVLFTCDPLTGNPTLMSITGNYGLGESVVSGSEEPDMIELLRDADDNLSIQSKSIGAKSHQIVMGDEGTHLVDVTANGREKCCLTDEMALRLGNLAVKIEKSYRSHRDIEWGFWNNNLYIFQSRPVTSGTGETDFEIDHELDGPLRAEVDYFTVCNVGEVMPGAMSPLGLQVILRYFRIDMQRRTGSQWQSTINPKYYPKTLLSICNHVMFSVVDMLERIREGKVVVNSIMIGFFGRVLDDEELFETAMGKYEKRINENIFLKYFRMLWIFYSCKQSLKNSQKMVNDYRIPVEKFKTSKDLYECLLRSCSDICEAGICHMMCSQSSSMWNMLTISVIEKAAGALNSDVYHDFSQLLASIGEVESADVPSAMQDLAFHIGNDINPDDFKKMEIEEAVQWLETTPSIAGKKYKEFLAKHSHRCLKEFDMQSQSWGESPQSLVKLLQNIVGNVSKDSRKRKVDFSQVMANLKTAMSFKPRCLLKILVPQCHKAVQYRENSKSLVIKGLNAWRKGYRHLGRMMVSEGRIPDEDILYFITLEELRDLLNSRSPKIISKANHRRRRHLVLDKYIFPEIMKGIPKPVNDDDTPVEPSEENFIMKGIPVSQGVAKGFVRLALTLEEASHLKPGEILLTYSTDIGWTPYFPTLAGVVTELGGLISHGAVVSREYGLPCIAGLHGATRKFQTGDYVLLDGNKGVLQKLKVPEKS